jgi:hypothetical protein
MENMVKTKLGEVGLVQYNEYCERLIDKIFKLLPLKEEGNKTLPKYTDSLLIELWGGREIINPFSESPEFLSLVCSVTGMKTLEEKAVYRSKVFECIEICKRLMIII